MLKRMLTRWWLPPLLLAALLLAALALIPPALGLLPAYLWTDRLILLLIVMVIFLVFYIHHKPHLRRPWAHVFRRRMAMASMVILLVYVVIGLLDSVHFRKPLPAQEGGTVHYSTEVTSLLDVVLGELRERVEKTYSAPFATHLYVKVSMEQPDGSQVRAYPRLKYGGAHLPDSGSSRAADITLRLLLSLGLALVIWCVLLLALAAGLRHRRQRTLPAQVKFMISGRTALPWHVALYTLLLLLFLGSSAALLATHYHVLGTDKVGQDVFFLTLKSVRTGLVIGTLTTLIMLPFAIALGVAAGYFRGWVDDVIQYLYTTLNSIPGVLLIAASILSIQVYIANHPQLFQTALDRADLRLLALCFILGITSWTGLCRLLRGETLKLRELEYIQAAGAFGVPAPMILLRHVVPNIMHIVLIVVVLDFSSLVLAEAVLSYVGVGVDPSTNSWGNMINGARLEMAREPMVWWSLLAAFVFMFVLVLAANLFADAVRDAFDPRLRRES